MADPSENMVLRSIYVPEVLDSRLRSMAFARGKSKSELIRQLIALGLDALDSAMSTEQEDVLAHAIQDAVVHIPGRRGDVALSYGQAMAAARMALAMEEAHVERAEEALPDEALVAGG